MGWRYRYTLAVTILGAAYALLFMVLLTVSGRSDLLSDTDTLFFGFFAILIVSLATLPRLGKLLAGTKVGDWIMDATVEGLLESTEPRPRNSPALTSRHPIQKPRPPTGALANGRALRRTGKWFVIIGFLFSLVHSAIGNLMVLAGVPIYFAGRFVEKRAERRQH